MKQEVRKSNTRTRYKLFVAPLSLLHFMLFCTISFNLKKVSTVVAAFLRFHFANNRRKRNLCLLFKTTISEPGLATCNILFCLLLYLNRKAHLSTKSSKHGPVASSEMEIQGFEVFGTFQLIFADQYAPKAMQSGHTKEVNPLDPFPRLK